MLQIVNKDILFRSFFQKHEKKGKNQSTKISRGVEGRTMSLGNSWGRGLSRCPKMEIPGARGGGGGSSKKNSFRAGGVNFFLELQIVEEDN